MWGGQCRAAGYAFFIFTEKGGRPQQAQAPPGAVRQASVAGVRAHPVMALEIHHVHVPKGPAIWPDLETEPPDCLFVLKTM